MHSLSTSNFLLQFIVDFYTNYAPPLFSAGKLIIKNLSRNINATNPYEEMHKLYKNHA